MLILNTVPPPPEVPPTVAVPYKELPDKINPVAGLAPPLLLHGVQYPLLDTRSAGKLNKVVKLAPSVVRANAVPRFQLPPPPAVPYRVLSDRNTAFGANPSLLV